MIIHRKANERGHADFGWLDSHHSFSFGQYHDPNHMGFGALRVINDDRVTGGAGFDTHSHKDMEIVSYVLDGALAHRNSLGSGSVIRPGDVQVMSAGTGVRHSEFNASKTDPVHFLQIWIIPEKQGLKPAYAEKHFPEAERLGRLRLIASPDGRDGSLTIRQDASILAAVLEEGSELVHPLAEGRRTWLQAAKGSLDVNGHNVMEGDGLAIVKEESLAIKAASRSEILLFDLQ